MWSRGLHDTVGTAQAPACSASCTLPSPPLGSPCSAHRMSRLDLFLPLLYVLRISRWVSLLALLLWWLRCHRLRTHVSIAACPRVFPVLDAVPAGSWRLCRFLCLPSLFKCRKDIFCLSFMNKYIHRTRNSSVWLHSLGYANL